MSTLTQNVQNIYNAFSDIKDAIEAQGVTVAANTPVTSYANLIGDISGGGGYGIETVTMTQVTNTISEETFVGTGSDAIEQRNSIVRQLAQKMVGIDSTLVVAETTLETGYIRLTIGHTGAANKLCLTANLSSSNAAIDVGFDVNGTYTATGAQFNSGNGMRFTVNYQTYGTDFFFKLRTGVSIGYCSYSGNNKAWLTPKTASNSISNMVILSENADIPWTERPITPVVTAGDELWHFIAMPPYEFDNVYWYRNSGVSTSAPLQKTCSDGTKQYAILTQASNAAMLFRSA